MPTKTLNQRIGLTTTNQSITNVQEISNDLQDKDINIETRLELNVTLITTKKKNHNIDNKIIHLDVPTEKLPSQEKKTESRKRKNTSRPHCTESKNRKTIRISNIKKHGESNNKYRHNAHDHNDISIDTQLIGRTRTPEKSRSPKNSSRKSHFSLDDKKDHTHQRTKLSMLEMPKENMKKQIADMTPQGMEYITTILKSLA
ncbi:unnamed protein product [Mytilus edulis]|uniref:Uncharacterized protein n=1 Tax=Mytilus edulis TaxID=6550 RepID=A0A8S3QCL8_MYTED|nr:unnamed protein product [Mytilus edulis]